MMNNLPPIPDGYSLVESNDGLPPIPDGYALVKPEADKYMQAAKKRIADLKAHGIDPTGGAARKFTQGATMGWSNDVAAYGDALVNTLNPLHIGDANNTFANNLRSAKAWQKAVDEENDKQTGMTGKAAELLGGLTTGSGMAKQGATFFKAGMGAKDLLKAGAKEGAVYGAIGGASQGDSLTDRAKNAATSAAGGGLLGGITPLAVEAGAGGLSKVATPVRSLLNPESVADAKIAQTLLRSDRPVDTIIDKMNEARAAGQADYTPVEAGGDAFQKMLASVLQQPSVNRTRAGEWLFKRNEEMKPRVLNDVNEALGATGTAKQSLAELNAKAKATAKPLYDAIPEYPTEIPDRLQTFLKEPLFQNALKKGVQIQRNNALAAGEDLAGYTLPEMHRANDADLNSFNFKNYQAMKIGLDNMLEKYRDPTTGKLVLDPEGVSIDAMRRSLIEDMQTAFPGYKEANAAYSGPMAVSDAVRQGQKAVNPGRIADKQGVFSNMTEPLQEGFRRGFADKVAQKIEGAKDPTMFPMSESIKPLVESFAKPDKSADLIDKLTRYQDMRRTFGEAFGNSKTAARLAEQEDSALDPTDFAKLAFEATHSPVGAAVNLAKGLFQGASGNREPVRNAIIERLLPVGEKQYDPAYFRNLLNSYTKKVTKAQRGRQRGISGLLGAYGGSEGLLQ